MSKERKIADNVLTFLNQASNDFGRIQDARFNRETYSSMILDGISSPIEDLFFIAFNVQCAAEYLDVIPAYRTEYEESRDTEGIFIYPQHHIGRYRVDFFITQKHLASKDNPMPVVVELDGHDFHDKDKYQRAHEKSRDRFLVKQGYQVLHFTGSEVFADPYKVAFEVISNLGVLTVRNEYDPQFPVGDV